MRRIALQCADQSFCPVSDWPSNWVVQHIGEGAEIIAVENLLVLHNAFIEVEYAQQRAHPVPIARYAEFLREGFQLLLVEALEQVGRGEIDILPEICFCFAIGGDRGQSEIVSFRS